MQASTVVIAAGERSIEAVLAAEALRRAARQQRVELAIEIRSNQGVTGALSDAQAAAATQLLLVGDGEADSARFGNAQIVRAGLGEVLDDPLAVLAQLAAASAPLPGMTRASASSPSPPARPASPTRSWRPKACSRRPRHWATRSGWKPRARSARRTR
jgi:fructose-specific phosphotransferase system component IIB